MKHLEYLRYVLTHKFWVLVYCFEYGLFRQGLVHDNSKFTLVEWNGYVNNYFSSKESEKIKQNYAIAWKHHYQNNKHHWLYWVNYDKVASPMPDKYIKEMIADWRAMEKVLYNHSNPTSWYNTQNMNLYPATRKIVEKYLAEIV